MLNGRELFYPETRLLRGDTALPAQLSQEQIQQLRRALVERYWIEGVDPNCTVFIHDQAEALYINVDADRGDLTIEEFVQQFATEEGEQP